MHPILNRMSSLMEDDVRSGDLQPVQELIRSGERVNHRLSVGTDSLLMVSISRSYNDVALALLDAGADVHEKDARGRTALHLACKLGSEEVVQALIDRGSRVDERDAFGATSIMCARDKTAMLLLRAGASCEELPKERRVPLFRHACAVGDLINVRTLLKNGCTIGTLSKVEQETLLYYACREGDSLVTGTLLNSGCSVSTLAREAQERLLCCACEKGDVEVVEALIDAGCNVNCSGYGGDTPLMNAAREGNEKIVRKFILAGANLAMQNEFGFTALHYAAIHNHIQCGILLAEAGASVMVKNKYSETPFHLARADFEEAIKEALSFTIRKTLCIIGNAEGGKSTLIASLQAEKTGLLGSIINRFRRVSDCLQRTAGIETVTHCSQRYGEVIFFDFAGQDDYHGPHQMFLESLLSKPGVSMTLLLVVKMTEKEDAILHQLHRWLTPVALMATPASPPHVIIIGSFLDKVKCKEEVTSKLIRCILATKKTLEDTLLRFVGTCFLNCRQPQSEGIDQLRKPQFQSSGRPTHVTALPGSCTKSGRPLQPTQSSCRTSLRG